MNCYGIIIILFVIIIFIFAFISSSNITDKESFTPKIREFYRPHIRNARSTYTSYYNVTVSHVSNIFRKFGIM
jgi:hypothetical protein